MFQISLLSLALLVVVTTAQRSPYAPGPLTYPQVLPQYASSSNNNGNAAAAGDIEDKFGDDVTTSRTTTVGVNLPGSLHDRELINRVSEWPKEKQPFWFLNNQQLAEHRRYEQQQRQQQQQQQQRQQQQQQQQQRRSQQQQQQRSQQQQQRPQQVPQQ